jgi:hypothetical protein
MLIEKTSFYTLVMSHFEVVIVAWFDFTVPNAPVQTKVQTK